MYRKKYTNLRFNHSVHPRVKLKQEQRFYRTCKRMFRTNTSKPIVDFCDQVLAARRHKFLFLRSQHIDKPIFHLKYRQNGHSKVLAAADYSFPIPFPGRPLCNLPITTSRNSTPIEPSSPDCIPVEVILDPPIDIVPSPVVYYGPVALSRSFLKENYRREHEARREELMRAEAAYHGTSYSRHDMRQHCVESFTDYQNDFARKFKDINRQLSLPDKDIVNTFMRHDRRTRKSTLTRLVKFKTELLEEWSAFSYTFTDFLDVHYMSHHYYKRGDTSEDVVGWMWGMALP